MGKGLLRCARLLAPAVVVLAVALPVEQANAVTAPKNTSVPVVSGTPAVGMTLSTTSGSWSGSPAPSFSYQWQRCAVGGSCASISGATKTTYLLVSADKGKQLRSRVVGKNSAGSATAFSARTSAVTAPSAPVNTAVPAVSGSTVDGATLSSTTGTWSGVTPMTYVRQWFNCVGTTCSAISNATGTTYQVQSTDVGDRLAVRVTATNASGSSSASSTATAIVAAAAPTNATRPTTVGTPTSGASLTSTPGTWNGTPPFNYTYQWSACDANGLNCSAINGATAAAYTPVPANIGARLIVTVTAANGTNPAGVASSVASAAVVSGPSPPVNNTAPTINNNSPIDGSVLTLTPGTWTNAGTLLHTWQQCDSGGANCTSIGGASGTTYTVKSVDVTHTIRVLETTSNTDGTGSAPSAATGVVAPAPPSNSTAPSFSGNLTDGSTLTAAPGGWSGTPTVTFTYQWQRSPDNGTFTDISGATQAAYQLIPGDITYYFRVVVTGHNASATAPSANSPAQGPVAAAPPSATVNPSITGAAQVHSTLITSPGTWSGSNLSAPAYQWLRCPAGTVPPTVGSCTNLTGNSGTPEQYTLVAGDQDSIIVVAVTRTNTVGTATAYSVPTAAVAPAGPVNTGQPSVTGTTQVGQSVSALTGSWAPSDSSFTYQAGDLTFAYLWQQCTGPSSCTPEPSGASGATYLVRTYDVGTTLAVSVTATDKYGQHSTSVLSPQSTTVVASAGPVTVANWSMADGGDGVMHDSSGYGNDGTLLNVALGQPDHSAAIAYGFPLTAGSVSRVVTPYSASLDPGTTTLTVSLHVKYDTLPTAAVGDYDLIRKGLSEDGQDWKVEILQGGHARCYANGATGPVDLQSSNAVPAGAWHTIICSFSTTGATIQVDGGTVKSKSATVGSISNSAPLSIAAKVSTGPDDGGDQYTGKMDQVVITSG